MSGTISHIVLRRGVVERDWKLAEPDNNGRKHLVTGIYPKSERPIADPEWEPGTKYAGSDLAEEEKTPVLVTGAGGTEIATFTEQAGQDRHKHRLSTEIYTVLKGRLRIFIEDQGPLELCAGDEIVILPGTVHQVIRETAPRAGKPAEEPALVVRVHALACHGEEDKFVQLEPGGEWKQWSGLSHEQKQSVYKKQAP